MNSWQLESFKKTFDSDKDIYDESEILSIIKDNIPNFKIEFKNQYLKQLYDAKIIYAYFETDQNKWFKPYKNRTIYSYEVDEEIEKVFNPAIKDKNIQIMYYDSFLFNSLSNLQSRVGYKYIGCESYAMDYLMDYLLKSDNVVIKSSDISKVKEMCHVPITFDFVFKSINQDTPRIRSSNNNYIYPKIETLLIDVLTDKELNSIYSSEINTIYKNAFIKNAVNLNTLFRYAKKKCVLETVYVILNDIDYDIKKGEFYD